MRVVLAPDARALLMRAGREITRSFKRRLIEDIANECDIPEIRLDEILRAFMLAGFWSAGLTIRQGHVTPKGISVAMEQAMRHAA